MSSYEDLGIKILTISIKRRGKNHRSSSPIPMTMKIVLGAFTGTPPSSSTLSHNYECDESSSSLSAASYILGTSYFANLPSSSSSVSTRPYVGSDSGVGNGRGRGINNRDRSGGGGFGANNSSSSGINHRPLTTLGLNKDGRVPMSDRKGPFDQFKSKSLILSTIRVTAINISSTLSTYFSDQLISEQTIESKVDSGELSSREADKLNEEWEEREWSRRKEALPTKIGYALCRFHACTAIMRLYEFIVARYVLRVDDDGGSVGKGGDNIRILEGNIGVGPPSSKMSMSHDQAITIMDNLTRDTFQASLRTSQIVHNSEHSPGRVISSYDGTESSTSRELVRRMFTTCLWANVIPFLAELTVQQGVLIYGYGVYYMAKQKKKERRRRRNEDLKEMDDASMDGKCSGNGAGKGGEDKSTIITANSNEDDDDDVGESAYALSFMFRSSRLSIARSMSWISASAGGALGCALYPGWGTVFGIQIGDAVVGALID